jgi:DNA mismatch endonuclease (patch repair protein)
MRAILSKNTKPELKLRALLEAAGLVFDLHANDLPGTPDIVLREQRIAIFVNGCFWHGHDCYLFRLPEDRRAFWKPKIEKTRGRDMRKRDALLAEGWRVLVVWECAIKGRLRQADGDLTQSVAEWIASNESAPQHKFGSIRCRSEVAEPIRNKEVGRLS